MREISSFAPGVNLLLLENYKLGTESFSGESFTRARFSGVGIRTITTGRLLFFGRMSPRMFLHLVFSPIVRRGISSEEVPLRLFQHRLDKFHRPLERQAQNS